MRPDVRSPTCNLDPDRDHQYQSETLHQIAELAEAPGVEGAAAVVAELPAEPDAVAPSSRTNRRTWHRAGEVHYIWDSSYSDLLDDYSFGFFDDDLRRVLGIVSEIEEGDIVVRDDKLFLERSDDLPPAVTDEHYRTAI
jgi:hypothetical protein